MKSWGPRREPLPPLNALIALEASARLGSFRAAAQEMHVTQGAVAQQVRAVEQEIGLSLFERHPRGLIATPEAVDFLDHVRVALTSLSAALSDLRNIRGEEGHQRVILSAPPSISARWLIPRLPEFYAQHPDISIAVDATTEIRPLVGPDRVDLAIRWGQEPNSGWSRPMLKGPFVVVASPGLRSRLAGKTPADITAETLIADGHDAWTAWFDHFIGYVPETASMTLSLSSLAIDAAERGIGMAISPEPLVRSAIAEGRLVRVLSSDFDLETDQSFHIVSAMAPKPGPVKKVSRWLLEAASEGA
ncbi:MAG: LysR substrate-binding domain-containing protein [Pseudomonadota bacterium]